MIKVVSFTCFALFAFAFNSILCRMALRSGDIDAASFTTIRLVSGALALALIAKISDNRANIKGRGNWISAFFLSAYAICFSFAYLGLSAGTGALVLFGCVQFTMIFAGLFSGDRPRIAEWVGVFTAFAGLLYLVFPDLTAPPVANSLLMAAAGAAWGFYTRRGRGSKDPIGDTAGNFLRTIPMVLPLILIYFSTTHVSGRGIVLAAVSGAVTSGVGYTIWYAALKNLSSINAGVVQLSVPLITAMIGIVLLSERMSVRLSVSALLIIGGILLTMVTRERAIR